jgi:hypothetical protein
MDAAASGLSGTGIRSRHRGCTTLTAGTYRPVKHLYPATPRPDRKNQVHGPFRRCKVIGRGVFRESWWEVVGGGVGGGRS